MGGRKSVIGNKLINKHSEGAESIYRAFYTKLSDYSKNGQKLPNISTIEADHQDMIDKLHVHDSNSIGEQLSAFDSKELRDRYIKQYAEMGIGLRLNKRSPITIQMENAKVTLNRYKLIPVSEDDRKRLYKREKVATVVPLDRELGLHGLPFRMTVKTMLLVAKIASESSSFEKAANILKERHDIDISSVTVINVTDHIGKIAFDHERSAAEKSFAAAWGDADKDGPESAGGKPRLKKSMPRPKAGRNSDDVLYIMVDGATLNTRVKDENGSSWRESKQAVVYRKSDVRVRMRTKDGKKEEYHKVFVKDFAAFIGSAQEYYKYVFACAKRMGSEEVGKIVMVNDGAAWIRNMKEELFGADCTQILDLWHLKQKVHEFAKEYFKVKETKDLKWCQDTNDALENGECDKVIEELKAMEEGIKKDKNRLSKYLENNRDLVDYQNFRAKGYITSSGSVESGHKYVMQARMKLAGMRWNVDSGQGMLILRIKNESKRWIRDVREPVFRYYGISSIV
jgi:hypothetical protein